MLGSGIYAPITLVAKGAEGFAAGMIGRRRPSSVWIIITGAYFGVLAALLSLKFYWPDPDVSLGDWYVQFIVLLVVAVAIYVVAFALREKFMVWTPVFLGIAVGGTLMVVGYFLGEYFLLDVGLGKALLEVPVNVGQVLLGGLIGALLSYYVKKSYPQVSAQQA